MQEATTEHEEKTSLDPNPLQLNEDIESGGVPGASSYHQEAKRLAHLKQIKDKLKGQYLRFDIPDGLDDTTSRFIMAVTLRYKFETPGESSVHGNFEFAFVGREHQQKCKMYAEPLIQRLHSQGVVFIRQLLPAEKMYLIMSDLGVTEEFLLIASSLLNVLHQISGGNYLNRKYLMAKCRHFLDTQNQMKDASPSKGARGQHFSLTSFLGECGAAGSDNYDDDDNPGGLWMPRVSCTAETPADCRQEQNSNPSSRSITCNHLPTTARKTRNRSWVLPYTAKIISQNELKHPALKSYRQGHLLDCHNSNCSDSMFT